MQFGFFVYLCAVFHNMVQGMYGLRKTGYVMVAALMVCAAAMSVIYQQDSETASSVPYRAYGCIAVISAASPAVEGSLELSTYFNTVTMSAGAEYRTVSSARTSVISAGASGIAYAADPAERGHERADSEGARPQFVLRGTGR